MPGDHLIVRARILAFALSCLGAATAQAAGKVSVSVGQAEFQGLRIEKLDLGWSPKNGSGGAISVRAARIRGIEATGPLSEFAIDCPDLRIAGDELRCERGRLTGSLGSLGNQDTDFTARAEGDGSLTIQLESFAFAGGRAKADVRLYGSAWQLDSALTDVDIAKLAVIAKPWLPLPEGFTVAGTASGKVEATGRADEIRTATADVAIARIDFGNAEGTFAGEAVTGHLRAKLKADGEQFRVDDGRLELTAGQAYSDPVFLDFGVHRADLDFAGRLEPATARFEADRFALDHAGVLQATGKATVDFRGETFLTDANLKIPAFDLATAVPAYIQPFLIDTMLKDIAGAGRMTGEVDIAGGFPTRAALEFADIILDSTTGSLSVNGLAGKLNWFDDASRNALAGNIDDELFQSRFSWVAASLWNIQIGGIDFPFATTGRHFRLLAPVFLPIQDGGLAIGTLRVRHAGTAEMYVRFDAEVRPISVAPLSRAFGWPEFEGTLAGSIPDMQLRQGVVTLGGNLEAAVFDGRVVVRDLQLREPLGEFPRLRASVDIENLDLEKVTSTFSFGMITGRLSGKIESLETFNWLPDSFDARFYTPPGDRSRHRISQRAVKNLSSIGGGTGGGVAAALQGGFLKFFDDFGYDRLGLSCRLANDVCEMDGVAPAPNGFYIVKGAGLPRIDVVGNRARVAWTRLVRQLARVTESEIVVQ